MNFKPRRRASEKWTLFRAMAELANAANGVRPLARTGYLSVPVFAFGWPTTEAAPLYLAGSMLDAGRRGLRGDFRGGRGRIALLVTAVAWALLGVIIRRNVTSKRYFDEPLEWEFYELWHHEGRRARMGAAMMAPDYAWWHGFYELKHRFTHITETAKKIRAGQPQPVFENVPGTQPD